MIVSRAIERCALVPLRPDGDDLLRTNPNNVLEAYSADSFKLGFLYVAPPSAEPEEEP